MIKINMGCGWRNFGSDWIHIDGGNYQHLNYRFIDDLEFDDGLVDLIYASHVIEYFNPQEAENLLSEWHRVLKPDGILRIAVPDFAALSGLYQQGRIPIKNVLGPLYGSMQMGDQIIYHKTVYDFESLSTFLSNCGFYHVKRYDWRNTCHAKYDDHSQAYIPHMDKENGTLISLNVECKKIP
jgi:predicted SAM-dependent methyltransferase